MRVEHPRFALVSWPDDKLGCIYLSMVDDAVQQGAVVIVREFEPVPVYDGEPSQSSRTIGDGEDVA